jgi:hypothetical protein
MAHQNIRLNLASAIFPFYTEAGGRTIMMSSIDENFDRYNAANTTPDKGVPQVFYMHNCMPISGGFQSISYDQVIPAYSTPVTDFDTCFSLVSFHLNPYLFVPAAGKNYIFDGNTNAWHPTNPFTPGTVPPNCLVTTAFIKGITYIYYSGIGCYQYNDATVTFFPVTLTGLVATDILGICEANGYMIAFSATAIAWSSISDPTNFVPNIQTGAGGGAVQEAKGKINFCVHLAGGFLIYCERNIVGASYTANTAFPYIIVEVKGSGGVDSIDKVAYQGNLPYMVAMTTAGLQQVSLDSAIPTMPEVSDFLTAKVFEDFDETTASFSMQYPTAALSIKLSTVSNKYIVLSYGLAAPDFTHAIIFDIDLNRYGKVKINHRSVFVFIDPGPGVFGSVRAKENLAFLQKDGKIQLANFNISTANSDGVFIIGKFQFTRQSVIIHQRTDVESIHPGRNDFELVLLPTFNGKDFAPAVNTTRIRSGDLVATFARRFTASNISLCCLGAFNLTSLIMNFTVGGSR